MKKNLLLIMLMAIVFAGCRSSQPVTQQFYLLELPEHYEGTWPERISVLSGSFELSEVQIATAYASHQIAVREKSHQLRYFSFNEWAIRPGIAFSQVMADFYKDNYVFEEVIKGRMAAPADYVLQTTITTLELDARGDTFNARLHVSFLLSDGDNTNDIIYQHEAERSLPLENKNLNFFAAAISKMFTEELHAFSVELLENLP